MSMGGGPLFGSGGFFGGGGGYGGGGHGGGGYGGWHRPSGPFGPWAGCGCSSLFIILAGILLVCGGCLRALNY